MKANPAGWTGATGAPTRLLLLRHGQTEYNATGRMQGNTFVAEEILAKHDESYMPREVIDSLKEQGVYQEPNS